MAKVVALKAGIELPDAGPIRKGDLSVYDRGQRSRATVSRERSVQQFLALSRKRWQTADAASASFRRKMRIDQKFAAGGGNQWDPVDRQQRADEGRPCLEINRIPQFIRQVANQARMNRSMIQVNPRGGGAVLATASAIQGVTRAIEIESDADVAYDTAVDHQLRIGLGFIRMKIEWAHKTKGMQKVIRLTRVRNPLSVYWDPSTQEADFSDMRYAHVVGVIGKDEYDAKWGHLSDYQSLTEFMRTDSSTQDWAPEGKVVVAEYFYVEVEPRTLCQLEDGSEVWQDEIDTFYEAFQASYPGAPAPGVTESREVQTPIVKWCLHNAKDILEGNADRTGGREVPGTRIPIFPVIGDELDLDGTVDYRGMTRDAIDPARMYNFWASSIAEAVALAPKAPWIAAAGQINNYLDEWMSANRTPHSALQYDPVAIGDHLVPAPQRNVAEPAIQAMVMGLRESDSDLKAVMGLFEPSLGEKGPQQSGKAITAMQQQGTIANSNYLDNLQRTKRSIGRCLLDWIPVVYDVATLMHLIMPDGKKKPAVVYAGEANKPAEGAFPNVSEFYDLAAGEYEVTISTGPSAQSERQATEAWLLELFKVLPPLAAIGADILLENSDNPASQQLAKRAKKMLPAQFQDNTDPGQELAQLQQKNAMLEQHAQVAHQAIVAMKALIDKEQIAAETKIEVAAIQARAAEAVALIKAGSTTETLAAEHASSHFENILDHAQDVAAATLGQAHALEAQAAGADQDAAATDQGAQIAADQSRQGAAQQAALESHKASLAPDPAAGAGA